VAVTVTVAASLPVPGADARRNAARRGGLAYHGPSTTAKARRFVPAGDRDKAAKNGRPPSMMEVSLETRMKMRSNQITPPSLSGDWGYRVPDTPIYG